MKQSSTSGENRIHIDVIAFELPKKLAYFLFERPPYSMYRKTLEYWRDRPDKEASLSYSGIIPTALPNSGISELPVDQDLGWHRVLSEGTTHLWPGS